MPLSIPNIRPISDLRTNLNDVCEQAQQTKQPIFMTKNGKASLIVIDCEAYEAQQKHDRYIQKLREAEIEAKYHNETFTQDQVNEDMQRIFDVWGV